MKKTLYHIGIFAAIALAFASCTKEEEQKFPEGVYKHTATVTLSKTEDTKTAVVINGNKASYVWTENDENYLHVFENGFEGTITKATYSTDFKTVTLEVSFDPTDAPTAPYTYTAKYYNEASNAGNPLIQASQSPKTDSFDPAADVLVSKEIVDNSTRLTELDFTMGRVVTVNKMTLTGLEKDEVIEKVEFTLDKMMVAYVGYDTANSTYKYTSVSGGTKITLNYTATTGVVPDGGEFPVYFVSAPVDAAGIVSVVVATDKNVYTKTNTLDPNPFSGKSITFEVGKFKTFTMGLAGFGAPKTSATDYTLVSAANGLPAEGKQANIIIVNGTNAMGVQNDNNRGVVVVPAAVNNVISLDNSSTAHVFTLAHTTDGYLISDNADNKYLYAAGTATSKTNYLRSKDAVDEGCYWTITYNEGVATVMSVNNDKTPYMRYNSQSTLFSCYNSATGQAAVSIYLDEDSIENIPVKQDVTLSFDPSNPADINLGDSFTEPTLTKSPSEAPVTYSVVTDPDGIATIDAASGELTITGAGEITVTATVSDLTHYNAASASYTLTVIDPNVVDYVTLDWTYPTSGAATSAGISAIDGVTVSGLGSDYNADNHSPYCIKFDNTDDYIQVKTDAAIGEVSVSYKMIGGSSTSTLNILESEDGTTWNSVEDLAISGAQNSTGVVTTSNAFDSASRYVKINFTKGSNVGIGGITITKVDDTPRFTVDSPLAATVAADDYTVDIHRKYFTGAITVTVPTECTWITASDVAANANTLSIHVDANPGVARTATLTLSGTGVTSQSLVVNQEGNEPGTEANPYTVAQAISAAGELSAGGQSSSEVYITGIISTVTSYSSTYKSITYYISDDGTTTDEFEVYSGKGLNGADFAAITDLAVGDKVTVKGYLKNYSGTLEVYQNNQIVAFISQATRYTVTYSNDGNGSVSGPTSVGAQGSVTVTITPNSGYELDVLTVGGTNVTSSVSDGKYTFDMPASNVTVAATFKVKTSTSGSVDFVPSDFSGQGTSGTGSAISATHEDITFACDKGYGTTQFRCYSGGKITISAANGKTITAISFTFSGSYTGGLETSYTGLSTTSWEKSLSSQARITKVTVTYE